MMLLDQIMEIPSIDSHEHIGSLPSCGNEWPVGGGFRIDLHPGFELAPTSLLDLFFAPYFGGLLSGGGLDFTSVMKVIRSLEKPENRMPEEGFWINFSGFGSLSEETQAAVWELVRPPVQRCMSTGQYVALRKAFQILYAADLDEIVEGRRDWLGLSGQVTAHYAAGLHRWCGEMFAGQHITRAIKPVHLQYVSEMAGLDTPSYREEKKIIQPILRIDDIMGHTLQERTASGETAPVHHWKIAEENLGVRIRSLDDIDGMVDETFRFMERNGVRSIKQMQAYLRTLRFTAPGRKDAKNALEGLLKAYDPEKVLLVQDYIMDKVLEKTDALEMTHQIHTGMANVPNTNPLLLKEAIGRHPRTRFVLLHCYPHLSDAAYMARVYRNVHLDSAWLSILSPSIFQKALEEWIGFVSHNKICLSVDSTSVEESCGGMIIIRERLAEVLEKRVALSECSRASAIRTAEALLYQNAERLYPR